VRDTDLVDYSRDVIRAGSKSFAAAAALFEPRTRASAYLLYAWCRYCDDQADGQEMGRDVVQLTPAERSARIDALYTQTRAALAGEAVEHPVFRAFQAVAKRHDLAPALAMDHLQGFRLDADGARMRSFEDLLAYCYHVAGAVGVMMAWIMGVRDEETLDRACDLGIAFQLTNIARDVVEDAESGRVYLPDSWLRDAGLPREQVGDLARPRGGLRAWRAAGSRGGALLRVRPLGVGAVAVPLRLGRGCGEGGLSRDRPQAGAGGASGLGRAAVDQPGREADAGGARVRRRGVGDDD
jgi:phytoene synthase